MNILLVTYEFPPLTATGGIGSYMYHLADLLNRHGNTVTVFSASPNGTALSIEKCSSCLNYMIPASDQESFRVNALSVFDIFLQHNHVDVIESPEVGACALLIKEKYPGIPLVVKMHSPGVLITRVNNMYTPLLGKLRFVAGALLRGKLDLGLWSRHDKNRDTDSEYIICEKADRLVSPSFALKNWAVSFWTIPARKITVIPNPFTLNEALFELPLDGRPHVISFVGKLSILKGMKAFTAAIPRILALNEACIVYVVGRDEIEHGQSMLAYMQKELAGYQDRIFYTGALSKESLQEIYRKSRVCVFPSLWENFPNVVLEAMSAGAAVAASRVGGIPEIVEDKLTGVLFNPSEPTEIAAAVTKLLVNDEARLIMVATARERLLKNFGRKEFQNNLLRVYSQFSH